MSSKAKIALSALSGLGIAISFLVPSWWPACWFGLFLFFGVNDETRELGEAIYLASVASLVTMVSLFYWINYVIVVYGDIPLVVSLALFALFLVVFGTKLPLLAVLLVCMRRVSCPRLITFPVAVAAVEMVQLSLFPWYFASNQAYNLYFMQLADVVGVCGLSMLMALAAAFASQCWRERSVRWPQAVVTVGLLAATYAYGILRVHQIEALEAAAAPVRVALVQPNTPLIWGQGAEVGSRVLQACRALTWQAVQQAGGKVDLIVWPEGGTPFSYNASTPYQSFRALVTSTASGFHANLLFDDGLYQDGKLYNNVWLMGRGAEPLGNYQKVMLLMFGEFVPGADWIPFLRGLGGVGQHQPGREIRVLHCDAGNIAPQICYEILTPSFTRKFIQKGADYIVNVSDDAWFGPTTESIEHLLDAFPRAIENRVPLVRCTNSGNSTMISASGRFLTPLTPLFQQTYQVADIRPPRVRTIYTTYGDVLGWTSTAAALLLAFLGARRGRERTTGAGPRNHAQGTD